MVNIGVSEAMGKRSMSTGSRAGLRLWVVLAGLLLVLTAQAEDSADPVQVEVAAYEFPPYYSSRLPRHLLGDLLSELNHRQQRFHFIITEVRPVKRYDALQEDGCCAVIFFESQEWGWQPYVPESVNAGVLLSKGADRYVRLDGETTEPMERIGGVVGYHYSFVDYQNDAMLLEEEHNLYLADTHRTLLNMLLGERLDMIVLSDEYLRSMKNQEPDVLAQLEVLDNVDQHYRTRVLTARTGPVPVEWLNAELQSMYEEGVLTALFSSFGLQDILIIDET